MSLIGQVDWHRRIGLVDLLFWGSIARHSLEDVAPTPEQYYSVSV